MTNDALPGIRLCAVALYLTVIGATPFLESASGELALPDNRLQQLQLGSAFRIGGSATASLLIARGGYDRDDAFSHYTINPLLTVEPALPPDSLDGRIDTTLIDFRFASRLYSGLQLATSFRLDDRDSKSPVAAYRYVPGDSLPQSAIGQPISRSTTSRLPPSRRY